MHCSMGCGWNCTHTTGFHAAFASYQSIYHAALPVSHPYHQRIAEEQCQGLSQPPPSVPSVNQPSTSLGNNGSLDKSKLVALSEHHE